MKRVTKGCALSTVEMLMFDSLSAFGLWMFGLMFGLFMVIIIAALALSIVGSLLKGLSSRER